MKHCDRVTAEREHRRHVEALGRWETRRQALAADLARQVARLGEQLPGRLTGEDVQQFQAGQAEAALLEHLVPPLARRCQQWLDLVGAHREVEVARTEVAAAHAAKAAVPAGADHNEVRALGHRSASAEIRLGQAERELRLAQERVRGGVGDGNNAAA